MKTAAIYARVSSDKQKEENTIASQTAALIAFAREHGYRRVVLWTNDPLVAARRIYLDAGFRLIAEQPHHSYGVDLVGQTYELELAPATL